MTVAPPPADSGEIDFSDLKKKKKTKKIVSFDEELGEAPAAADPSDAVRPLEDSANLTATGDDLDFSDLKKVRNECCFVSGGRRKGSTVLLEGSNGLTTVIDFLFAFPFSGICRKRRRRQSLLI
jgi:hypothetical protein